MKIFISGSTTGLGFLAGEKLLKMGHEVVFHARGPKSKLQKNLTYAFGDLTQLSEVKLLADQLNSMGKFDAVIHNAGVYTASSQELFAVNVLAPYVLTSLMQQPQRLVFLSSGMHLSGKLNLDVNKCSYSDTKLFDLMLAKYFARLWPNTLSNAVDPGWVPTRMGGAGAPDDLQQGADTQVWLVSSNESSARVTGKYFHHLQERQSNPIADSIEAQEDLVKFLKVINNNPTKYF